MSDFRYLVLPLFIAVLKEGEIAEPLKYLGMAFFINKEGTIATCSHLISNADPNKSIIGIQMHNDKFFEVKNIKCHERYDFAIAETDIKDNLVLPLIEKEHLRAGTDIVAYGVNTAGMDGQVLDLHPRFMKGYLVRVGEKPAVEHARSVCEVSFPSLSGFSGTPIVSDLPNQQIVGMLYGNYESTIELHNTTEIEENGSKYSEQIHRVLEFGLAHTADDIYKYLEDLGYLDGKEPRKDYKGNK